MVGYVCDFEMLCSLVCERCEIEFRRPARLAVMPRAWARAHVPVIALQVHFAATKEVLAAHFSQAGAVTDVRILLDPATGRPRG